MGCKYVKEFEFGPEKTYVKGYARGGEAKAAKPMAKPAAKAACAKGGYAKGGKPVVEKATGEKYANRREMAMHEAKESPREQRMEAAKPARKSVPVARKGPLIPMRNGGEAKRKYADGGNVMTPAKADDDAERQRQGNRMVPANKDMQQPLRGGQQMRDQREAQRLANRSARDPDYAGQQA